jgi:hypothetical protein
VEKVSSLRRILSEELALPGQLIPFSISVQQAAPAPSSAVVQVTVQAGVVVAQVALRVAPLPTMHVHAGAVAGVRLEMEVRVPFFLLAYLLPHSPVLLVVEVVLHAQVRRGVVGPHG